MNFIIKLSRKEMKGIKAGSTGCRLFLRTTDGDNAVGYSPHCYTQEQAESSYGAGGLRVR